MSEMNATNPQERQEAPSLEVLFSRLLELEPKPIANFVPTNGAEQKELFLSGAVRNPDHVYGKLADIDFDSRKQEIINITAQLVEHPEVPEKYKEVYADFGQNYLNKTRFMELAYQYKTAENEEQKAEIGAEYMRLNIELFGEPDELTYRSLLAEKLNKIKAKDLSGKEAEIRDELFELIGEYESPKTDRFRPSAETIEWVKALIEELFGKLLDHVPEQDTFSDAEIKAVFDEILLEEFGDAAEGWEVVIEEAQSINVKAAERRIIIPIGKELSHKEMRGRVVHELGVHFMRSLMGEQTDLLPFRLGLSEYYDGEEGTGAVAEQALVGTYREAGVDHYITAGLQYHDAKDFHDTHEIKWRLALLSASKPEATDENIANERSDGYGQVMRFDRGTDDIPWFKDLSYYNGASGVWKHYESILGDDLEFVFVLLGKGNPANPKHKRIMLETATV